MTVLEQLRLTTREAGRACAILEAPTPEALDRCSAVLQEATRILTGLQHALPDVAGDPEALAEAWRLRGAFRRAAVLLAHADDYHHQWRDLVAVRTAGYGSGGRPGELPLAGRLSVRG